MTPADIQHVIDQPGGYRLSEGVYATREAFEFRTKSTSWVRAALGAEAWHELRSAEQLLNPPSGWMLMWWEAAKRLRYQEGQPCAWIAQDRDPIYCGMKVNEEWRISCLHRVAALICDNANAFRVLYWCITELGGEDES